MNREMSGGKFIFQSSFALTETILGHHLHFTVRNFRHVRMIDIRNEGCCSGEEIRLLLLLLF